MKEKKTKPKEKTSQRIRGGAVGAQSTCNPTNAREAGPTVEKK